MRLLVVGGTVFVGRAVVEAAVARGHEVTVFHRGQHGEAAGPDVEHLHGDRRGDLAVLGDRSWDAVIDTCGFSSDDVRGVASRLRDTVRHYGFVSSLSTYRDWPQVVVTETSVVKEQNDPDGYGAGKVAAERELEALLPGRVLQARAGLIVGPHENIGRLPYWLRRIAAGGEVLAPAPADEGRQLLDVRDLAAFHIDAAERGIVGPVNLTSQPGAFTMGELLTACSRVTASTASLRWVEPSAIVAAGIEPWTDLPIWFWEEGVSSAHAWHVDVSLALRAGFVPRSIAETVADTWAWLTEGSDSSDGYRADLSVGDLDPEREQAALGSAS
jgi:nucleoside-diphosphate-sugar epimerase